MAITKFNIVDVTNYTYAKDGGTITLKFDNGVTTRRYCVNTSYTYPRVCSLSGKEIPPNEICTRVTIKKSGYGQYVVKASVITEALRGKFKKVDEGNTLVKELRRFLDDCHNEKIQMNKRDAELRQALREIKFRSSKLGVKMSKANQLLEVLEI